MTKTLTRGTAWRTFGLPARRAYAAWKRCLWCGETGHWREDCAREHAHGAVTRSGVCLGCGEL